MIVEYHADDYGLFPAQSRRILDCYENGALNGISIMPNSPYLAETMQWIAPYRDKIAVTVHLNFMEGTALAGRDVVPDLVDANGNFSIGFGRLLLISYCPPLKRKYQAEVKAELKAQIQACLPYLDTAHVRLDGHGHYHMLPVIFDALAELIAEEGWQVDFIRVPMEDVAMYRRHRKEIHDFKFINYVKVAILNHLGRRNLRKHPELFRSAKPYYFCGVMLSGHMSWENVAPFLEDAKATAKSRGQNLELLFHPGAVLEEEDIARLTSKDDVTFLTSNWRAKEADALKRL